MGRMESIGHPGGFMLTERAFESIDLPESAKVLDIGCGLGDTASYLTGKYGYSVTGIDKSAESVSAAMEKHPGVGFKVGDGQWLDFDSLSFDCVLMECTLSLMTLPVEAIHEAYCVLKENGYLIVHDLYVPNPSEEDQKALDEVKNNQKQQIEGACREERESICTVNGALILGDIFNTLSELGFEPVLFEDRKSDLDSYAASMIFKGEEISKYYDAKQDRSRVSYFLMVARKTRKAI